MLTLQQELSSFSQHSNYAALRTKQSCSSEESCCLTVTCNYYREGKRSCQLPPRPNFKVKIYTPNFIILSLCRLDFPANTFSS